MWLPDDEYGSSCSAGDDAADGEVLSAVHAYCRLRHGTSQLPNDYIRFLFARTRANLPALESKSMDREALWRELEPHVQDCAFVRALVHADDPGELAEAYRRKLMWVSVSDLCPGRSVLHVSLQKIDIDPARDLPMAWAPALRRVARWSCDWRTGNDSITNLKIIPNRACFEAWPEARSMLQAAVRKEEADRHLEPAELVWVA